MPPLRRRDLAALAAILVATAAAYARVLHGELVFDDLLTVVTRGETKDLAAFVAHAFAPALLDGGLARPVTDLSFALNWAAAGLDPFGYHAVNVAIHLAAVLLAFAFTRETLRRAGWASPASAAIAVAALFALHPMQSQAVSYVSQRSESLASALYLAALLLLGRAEGRLRTARGATLYAAATLAFLAGLGTKLVIATAPLAYVAWRAWFPSATSPAERRRELGWSAARVLPWTLAAGASAVVTLRGLAGVPHAGFDVARLTPSAYLLTQARVVVRYLALLAFPAGQNLDPDLPITRRWTDAPTIASGLLLAALGALGAGLLWSAARSPERADAVAAKRVASFGVAWFFLLLAPTSSVVPIADVLAEHRVYLASWGIFAAAVVGASLGIRRLAGPARAPAASAALTGAVALALALALHARNAVWESSVALWTDVVAKSPGKARGWSNLGHALLARGDAAAAGASLERSLALDPSDARALNTLALLHLDAGRLDAAELRARQAAANDPLEGAPYNTLGEVAARRGDAEGALALFRESVARGGAAIPARLYNVAATLEALGRRTEACDAWRAYLRAESDAGARSEARAHASAAGCPPR